MTHATDGNEVDATIGAEVKDGKAIPQVVADPGTNKPEDDATAAPSVAEAKESYKIISLKFAVYNSGKIAVLEKKEEATEQTADLPDAVVVYENGKKVDDYIPNAINLFKGINPKVAEGAVVDETVNTPEVNGAEGAEVGKKTAVVETKGVEGTNLNGEPLVGGSRKAQPKNVSFSRKYPKHKSNKKTLRNLERIASH